tara:strand:- start:677 stop:1570 length:894 start_codon:yes stop_codon:yes gene_type:complete
MGLTNKKLFKNNLKLIEIEIFSYCNRICWFCPNSFIDRRTTNIEMKDDHYEKILTDLAEIDYAGEITYSRYNEPLSHRDIFIRRIKRAREFLPNAILKTNTNGDYVTRDYIKELNDIGFNQLWIQQYLGKNEKYDHERMRKFMNNKVKKLDLDYTVLTDIENCRLEYDLLYGNMTIHLRARNFELDGSSRGEAVPLAQGYVRTQLCEQVHNNMYIDYNGTVMICCALRSDVPRHENGIMAHVDNDRLWDIWRNEKYEPWRKHHMKNGPKKGVCKSCRDSVIPDYMIHNKNKKISFLT